MKNNIDNFYVFDGKYAQRMFYGFSTNEELGYDFYNNCYKHVEDTDNKIKFVEMLRSIKL